MDRSEIEQLAAHTPGPWGYTWSEGEVEIFDGTYDSPGCERLYIYKMDGSLICSEADACLIAASPDLLGAAEAALNYIANTEGELGITLGSGDLLRAAIAKALSYKAYPPSRKGGCEL